MTCLMVHEVREIFVTHHNDFSALKIYGSGISITLFTTSRNDHEIDRLALARMLKNAAEELDRVAERDRTAKEEKQGVNG